MAKISGSFAYYQKLTGEEEIPIWFLRFNPDEYDKGKISLDERIEVLSKRINELLELDVTGICPLRPIVEYYYYHTKGEHHIKAVIDNPDCFNVQFK